MSLIEIENLRIRFKLREGTSWPLNGVSFSVDPHQTLGLVGESGCGKSLTAKAIMQLLPPKAEIVSGSIRLSPRQDSGSSSPMDLVSLPPHGRTIRRIRGRDIAMIFQEPLSSLSPVHTVGNQICEVIRLHQDLSHREAKDKAIQVLTQVGVPNARQRLTGYPHELSGGLRQRVMIAKALSCDPRLLIADEPTTALDVTLQSQILRLIQKLQSERGMAILMITHDLSVIAEVAHAVVVMYLGRIVEKAIVHPLFEEPKHPYTMGLLASIPQLGRGRKSRLASIPGTVPDPLSTPEGCPFHPRCERRIQGTCDQGSVPDLKEISPGHWVACYLYGR